MEETEIKDPSKLPQNQPEKLIEFQVFDYSFAFELSYVREVQLYPQLMTVRDTNDWIEGIYYSHDRLITVVNPFHMMNLPEKWEKESERDMKYDMLIVLSGEKDMLALHVHQIIGLTDLIPQNYQEISQEEKIFSFCETGVLVQKDQKIHLLNIHKMIDNLTGFVQN